MPIPAMIGRMTKGGLVRTSKPLMVAATGVGLADGLGLSVGEGVGDGEGDVSVVGDAAVGCNVKLAHGLGCTLAHRR